MNDSQAFGSYICKANNLLGGIEQNVTLIEGTKPEKPTHLQLRGVNSDTFDIDVNATRKSNIPDRMDVNGYRFEITSVDELRANGGKWDKARIVNVKFGDGESEELSASDASNLSVSDTGITYLISNLASNTTYMVRVAARNPAGLSDWTGPEEFKTHPKEPLGLPSSASFHGVQTIIVILSIVSRFIQNPFEASRHFNAMPM